MCCCKTYGVAACAGVKQSVCQKVLVAYNVLFLHQFEQIYETTLPLCNRISAARSVCFCPKVTGIVSSVGRPNIEQLTTAELS